MLSISSSSKRFAIVLAMFLVLLVSCKKDRIPHNADTWAPYLHSHSQGAISRYEPLRIRFVEEQVTESSKGKPFNGRLEIEPSVSGSLTWEDASTLIFTPSSPWAANVQYTVKLYPDNLQSVPASLPPYAFGFTTIQQTAEIEFNGFTPSTQATDTLQDLSGFLVTADKSLETEIKAALSAEQNKKNLEIRWTFDPAGRRHAFAIKNLHRTKKSGQASITFAPQSLGINTDKSTREFKIPSLDEFEVVFAKAEQSSGQYIQIRFSDPLNPKTDFAGLVKVSGQSDLRYSAQGNTLNIFFKRKVVGSLDVSLSKLLSSSKGIALAQDINFPMEFKVEKPGLRFVGNGVILPDAEHITTSFEAINLNAVDVDVFQIYESNMGQFFQVNDLKGFEESRRVGRFLWRKKISLEADSSTQGEWKRYQLDLSDLMRNHPNSIFRVELRMNPAYTTYPCTEERVGELKTVKQPMFANWDDMYAEAEASSWDYFSNENADTAATGEEGSLDYYSGSSEDPCDPYFYNQQVAQNFIAADIGLIAKQGRTGELTVATASIRTAEPMGDVDLEVFNFQNQKIAEGSTNSDGIWTGNPKGVPFYIHAKSGDKTGYLKVNTSSALAVSHFEVDGEEVQRGLKGTIYGERGVWRPGDTLYLTFVLQDPKHTLPKDHPVRLELRTPTNALFSTQSQPLGASGFNTFRIATDAESPTGAWRAKIVVGDVSFEKSLSIETVKPNHLKVNLGFGADTIYGTNLEGNLFAQWLNGANADGLTSDVNVVLNPLPTKFSRYADYEFNDPVRTFAGERSEIYNGTLEEGGKANFTANLSIENPPPGMLQATFTTRVFEESGDFSIDHVSVPLHYFDNYVGIKTPKGDAARGMLLTDTTHRVLIAGISNRGKPVNLKKVHVSLSKMTWQWWWEKSAYNLSSYESRSDFVMLQEGDVEVKNGQGYWDFKIKYPEWGRYLIEACDESTGEGHCTGKIVYIDWPGWAGRAGAEDGGVGATMLSLSADKKKYNVGETAILQIPAGKSGRALLSIENGSRVLSAQWLDTKPGTNKVEIKLTQEMAPNVYAHVTLVQPHQNKDNDLPIRLYGVIPLYVEDPQSHLQPILTAPKEVRPQTNLPITIREKDGKAMTYTLAIVDEGLLGLTRYQTPDLWKEFNRKEALGVRTWDMYDYVAGAYGASLERLLALGGDEGGEDGEKENQKRFPPLVRFYGPLHLAAGQSTTMQIPIPEYMGAVRAMVVAGEGSAFGQTEQSIYVRRPLMVLATIPRVMRPDEEAVIPVTVFCMKEGLGEITVQLKVSGLEVRGAIEQKVQMSKPGEKMVYFRVRSPKYLGTAKLSLTASAQGEVASQNTNLQIMAPNPRTTISVSHLLAPQNSWNDSLIPHGLWGTNQLSVYLSRIPDLNLENHLNALIGYPYGCVEQTTSKAFPQLYLKDLMQLSAQRQQQIQTNVLAAIQRLKSFQTSDGSFTYWPGTGSGDPWATSYVGHFLLEASRQGYAVPPEMLANWKQHQIKEAGKWSTRSDDGEEELQSYRLFSLALAGAPEMGAMNRLREQGNLVPLARMELAAAYGLAGRKDVAMEQAKLAQQANSNAKYQYLYGEDLRDMAMELLMQSTAGASQQSFDVAKTIAERFGAENWWSTQSTAWALMALSRTYGGSGAKTIQATFQVNKQGVQSFQTDKPLDMETLKLGIEGNRKLTFQVTNKSAVPLFVRIANSGILPAGMQKKESFGLTLKATFTDIKGTPIDPQSIAQGTDLIYWITITNTTAKAIKNVALSQLTPSGWEILNSRMDGASEMPTLGGVNRDFPDYYDQRDDRMLSFFNLAEGATKRFPMLVHTSYLGEYLLPGAYAEAMYDNTYRAALEGSITKVTE